MKTALVTGAGGQDGSYMCELLLARDYEVSGVIRPSGDGGTNVSRLMRCLGNPKFHLVYGDILDQSFPRHCLGKDEVYHFAAQSHVGQAFYTSPLTFETNTVATSRILEVILNESPQTKLFFAATSEMFGDGNARGNLVAHSPYAASKIAAYQLACIFRRQDIFVVNGISYNHESPRRGDQFVTQKVAKGLRQFLRDGTRIPLGNVEARRDWHDARDTVEGIYLAMQHDEPRDWVFASGIDRSVKEMVDEFCYRARVQFDDAIEVVESEKRPWDVDFLKGDPTDAERILGWRRKILFSEMIGDMWYATE